MKVWIVATLLAPFLLLTEPAMHSQGAPQGAEPKEVKITAKKYEFSPDTVDVNVGTHIVFKITALDREHGFEIANAKEGCVKIKKGQTAVVEYTADKPGTVEFRCCVFCGMGHSHMKGKIVVH